ncbi:MAG: hypothetical protein WC451_05360 [Patescibacteria group bacterium]
MSREERNLQNSKQNKISDIDYYPVEMAEGAVLFAFPKSKLLRLYKKIRGINWWIPFTRDGNYIFEKEVKCDSLKVVNDAVISGVSFVAHTHEYYMALVFGYNAEISATSGTTTADAHTADGSANTQGYKMLHAGTVTGFSIQYRCTSLTTYGWLAVIIEKNGVATTMAAQCSVASVSNDLGNIITTNSFAFNAGDKINVFLSLFEGDAYNAKVEDIAIVVEIKYSTGAGA